jgi:hypothetical protein
MCSNLALATASAPREFYLWVPKGGALVEHNLKVVGSFFGGPITPNTDTPASLMFLPNPNHVPNIVTPFHLGVMNHYRIEYGLEVTRFNSYRAYPSRFFALFVLDNVADAQKYREVHPDHVGSRVLKRGVTVGDCKYSLHDATWIDFLRLPHSLDQATLDVIFDAYWRGAYAKDAQLSSMGAEWSQSSVTEVLFYGRLDFPDRDLSRSDVELSSC